MLSTSHAKTVRIITKPGVAFAWHPGPFAVVSGSLLFRRKKNLPLRMVVLALIAELSILDMPQLIVRQIEEKVVNKLKQQAGAHGVSMEEEHRRILRKSLLGNGGNRKSFKDALRAMPNVGTDADFERAPQHERPIEL